MLKAIDLYCGAGGASMGLHRAGFNVTGVDINEQPNYPFDFIRGDVIKTPVKLEKFDFIWASPPCQNYTWATEWCKNSGYEYVDLVSQTREILDESGLPYVIENVTGAPIREDLFLNGDMFNLPVRRRRIFETNGFKPVQPSNVKMKPKIAENKSYYMCVAGHGGNSSSFKFSDWCDAMGIHWMKKEELVLAIPPDYSEYIGKEFIRIKNFNWW